MVDYFSTGDDIVHKMIAPETTETGERAPAESDLTVKPSLIIRKEEQGVHIKFSPQLSYKVNLYSKRSSEDSFILLAQVSGSHYLDTRPNLFGAPELREYMAYYVRNEIEIGQASDVVLIIKK